MIKDPKNHQKKYSLMKKKRHENAFIANFEDNINRIQKTLISIFIILLIFCITYSFFVFDIFNLHSSFFSIIYSFSYGFLEVLFMAIPLLFVIRVWKEFPYDTIWQFIYDFLFCVFFVLLHSISFELNIFTDIFVSSSVINTYVLRLFLIHLTIFLFILFVSIILFIVISWIIKITTSPNMRRLNLLESINSTFFTYLKKVIAALFVLSGFITVTIFANTITKDIFDNKAEYAILQQDLSFYKTLVVSSLFIPTYRYVFNKK